MTERNINIFDKCRDLLVSSEKPYLVGAISSDGHVKVLYTYTDNQKGQERLLFCGFRDSGLLAQNQILAVRNKGEQAQYYFVHWGDKLVGKNRPAVNRKPEGDFINPQLVIKMKAAIKKEISYADLVGGYIPLDEKDSKKINAIWGF